MSDSTATGASGLGSKGVVTTLELDRQERQLARRSAETRAIIPSVDFAAEVDMQASLRRDLELGCGTTALLVEATAHALSVVRRVNGAYRDGRYELYSRINIAVTVDDGVPSSPVVFDADTKSPTQIAAELGELRERSRRGTLTSAELSGATFTLSDTPGSAVAMLTPLIVPTQAAALAAGPVCNRPVIRDGVVVPGHTMVITLACDHRIVYRAHAAAFLREVKVHLEEEGGNADGSAR